MGLGSSRHLCSIGGIVVSDLKVQVGLGVAIGMLALATVPSCIAETVEVAMEKSRFVPQHLKVRVGTSVKWVNKERRNNHSVWFKQEGLPGSERLFPGDSWERRFDKAGVYPYICEPHPEMTGVIEVVP